MPGITYAKSESNSVASSVLHFSLVVLLCLPGTTLFAAENPRQTQQELAAVTSAIDEIQSWLSSAVANYSSAEETLRESELELAVVSRSVATIREDLQQTNAEIEILNNDRLELDQAKSAQYATMSQLLRAAYMAGEQSQIKLLLGQKDLSSSSRMLHYYQVYSAAQLDQLQQFQATLDALDTVTAELESRSRHLAQQEAELARQLADLEQVTVARQLALLEMTRSIASRNAELEQLQQEQLQLQQLVDQISRAIERIPPTAEYSPFPEQRGQLPLPLVGPVLTSFGARYGDGNLRRQGITIAAQAGTPVQAIHPGRVVFADWLRGAGLLVIVDHGDGYMSLYGANQSLAKTAGAWVNRGEVLATSGDGNSAEQTGLYFEIRHHGTAQDPQQWLRFAD